jgi:hypothetical protein
MKEMEEKLGIKVGKGKVDPEVLRIYTEVVAPEVLPKVVRAILEAVFKLDDESRNRVLEAMGKACYEGFRDFVGAPPTGVDIESACKWLDDTVPHSRRFQRAGDTIYWEADVKDTYGGCMCMLVRLGIIEPRPELCVCSTNHCKSAFEEMTGLVVEGEMVESLNTGAQNCVYRYHFRPTAYSSRPSKQTESTTPD